MPSGSMLSGTLLQLDAGISQIKGVPQSAKTVPMRHNKPSLLARGASEMIVAWAISDMYLQNMAD